MKVEQIYGILNTVVGEVLGKTDLVAEDLSNIVDVGKEITGTDNVDKYVRKLINHIGKVIFVDRSYKGQAPSVLMDGWEYGSILEKIQMELPDSVENSTWALQDGQSYDPNVFHAPKVDSKFFNSRVTYEIDMSFAERQVKQSFSNVQQLNAFFSMIDSRIRMRKTIDYDNLIMRTINNFTAATIHSSFPDVGAGSPTPETGTSIKAVNLLFEYNALGAKQNASFTAITPDVCLHDLGFLKYAAYRIGLYSDRFEKASNLFNIGGKTRFTPKDMQHLVLLSEFTKAAGAYLQSDTFHDEFVKLPKSETVTFWQGSGRDYSFGSTSDIHVNIANPANVNDGTTVEVVQSGILGVLFDRDALGVCNVEDRVPSIYNPKGEFINNFYKSEAQYFNDYNENFVVFFAA